MEDIPFDPYPIEQYPSPKEIGKSDNRLIRLYIADDHKQYREELSISLQTEPDIQVCGEAESSLATIEGTIQTNPDVLLIELEMSGVDGIQSMRQILAERPQLRVILMSLHSDAERVLDGLRAGALAHISKFARPDEFAHAIRAVYRGEAWIDTQTTERVLREIRQNYSARGSG